MLLAAGMAIGSAAIQMIGAYLRYLPFEESLSPEDRRRLWRYLFLWMAVAVLLYAVYFSQAGVNVTSYKRVNYLGPWPFFAISLYVIRNEGPRHVFMVGMQTLWFLLLHTMSGSLILALLPNVAAGAERIPYQTAGYIFFFLLTLPIANPMFRTILPPPRFFRERPLGWYFALLPLGFCVAPIVTLIDRPMMYTWTDRISRFFLLFWVFIIYRYASLMGRRSEEIYRQEHTHQILTQQLQGLQDHAALLESRAQDVRRARHDLRHYNRLLATLLDAGETAKAREIIDAQERELLAPPLQEYCKSPIVNAALTVYLRQAKDAGAKTVCKVRLDEPERSLDGDNDLAILLSNVIENAVIASCDQPEGEREIRLSLQYIAPQYVLSLENRYDKPILFGSDGLPTTSAEGHGIGMVSLAAFRKKYDADVVFEQEDGWVRLMIYWVTV